MKCTWKGCNEEGTEPQHGTGGDVWATLCPAHSAEFKRTITRGSVGLCFRAWTLAQGGAEVAARRVLNS